MGTDAGSRAIKGVLLKSDTHDVSASGTMDEDIEHEALALQLFQSLLQEAKVRRSDVSNIVATGYGRNIVGFAEITIK